MYLLGVYSLVAMILVSISTFTQKNSTLQAKIIGLFILMPVIVFILIKLWVE